MLRNWLISGLLGLILLGPLSAIAQPNAFDVNSANASLNRISNTLTNGKVGIRYLERSVETLTRLNNRAQECEKQKSSELKKISDQLTLTNKEIDVKKTTEEKVYLKKRVDLLSDELSQCRLFALKSDEAIAELQTKIQSLAKLTLIQSKAPSYQLVQQLKLNDITSFSTSTVQIIKTITVTLLLSLLLPILWFRKDELLWCRKHRKLTEIAFAFGVIFAIFVVLLTWSGYHGLVWYFFRGASLAVIYTLIFYIVTRATNIIFDMIKAGDSDFINSFYRYLGVRKGKLVPEVLVLQLVVMALLITVYVMYMVDAWEYSGTVFHQLYVLLSEGMQLGTFKLVPMNIMLGMIMLSLIGFLTRYLRQWIYRNVHLSRDVNIRTAAASLLGYVGFGLALLISLLVAGVNLTGLAIVAGALSVGAGFGLQGVVNNFVSGLILLIEQPIKPGDRIIVGETEGHVKKIRMRSTQITTLQKTDVIVPNSDLVSNQVTNLMFMEKSWRVETTIGVAYGSDLPLVQRLLVEVAKNHPDVVNDDKTPAPRALLLNFGESTIDFELRCVVKDVDLRNRILSDLHMEIDRVFKEHDIVIAFPQRDVHIIHETKE